ncbi:MAG: hypothetical protein Q8P46_14975 [Hyphomicrobiales bacterium]|nr:hypothetical protein [Hyphomicrobiales bacterium]
MPEGLFSELPQFPPALSDEELQFLASLPVYDDALQTVREIAQEDERICRRLERRGLVKIHRWKDDPAGELFTMYAGKLPAATIRGLPA